MYDEHNQFKLRFVLQKWNDFLQVPSIVLYIELHHTSKEGLKLQKSFCNVRENSRS
jgi:hypothetical protein